MVRRGRHSGPHRRAGRGEGRVRIIGGRWRGRRLHFSAPEGLRPTPDRVRETLFNWLQPWLPGARCLDLFAGSGVLALEALSRGAERVVAVEREARLAAELRERARLLDAEGLQVVCMEAAAFLDGPATPFDILFLDPPYGHGWLPRLMPRLEEGGWLAPLAPLYLEAESPIDPQGLPEGWELIRSGRAGQVAYHLVRREERRS